jgi:hypothetical protein
MRLRKIYYAPGVISLIGLSFLLPYALNKTAIQPTRAISFVVPKESDPNEQTVSLFTERWLMNSVEKKKKIRFFLNAERKTNENKIDLIRSEARRLKYTFDSNSVILIEFSNDLLYGELFRLLDNCIADSIRRYATFDNKFVIFGETTPKEKSSDSFGCFLCNDLIITKETPPKKSIVEWITGLIKPFSLLQIGSLGLLWLLLIYAAIKYRLR